jgi:Nif-specific regulatory protein
MEPEDHGLDVNILSELEHVLGEVLDLDRALERFLGLLAAFSAMTRGLVILPEVPSGAPVLRASTGLSPGEADAALALMGEKPLPACLVSGKGCVWPSLSHKPLALDKLSLSRWPKRSLAFLGAPVTVASNLRGLLLVDRLFGEDIPLAEDLRVLDRLTALLARLVDLHHQVVAREEKERWEHLSLRADLAHGRQHLLVGKSPVIQVLRHTVTKVAESRAPVMLIGEAGVGKTLTARLIHEMGPQSSQPFIKINCATLPEDLLEAELFGGETGLPRVSRHTVAARLEEAGGGTLFLAEVDRLSPVLQTKLLRFMEDQGFRRMGGGQIRRAEVRLISATRKDLRQAIKEGRFLEDLFTNLAVLLVHLPPLRDRPEDIPALLNYFLDHASRESGRRFSLTQPAQEALTAYSWPGNVREMEHLVERLAVMAETSAIHLEDLPPLIFGKGKKSDAAPMTMSRLKELEKREIMAALERHQWVQSQAAMELGLTLRQMGYRVKQFGLDKLVKERRIRGTSSKGKY